MELYALALLPFALLSFFNRGDTRRSTAGFLGLLAALAPVIAKGIGSLVGHKQEQSKQKQAEEQAKLQAQAADAQAKSQWEASMNTPAAQASRFKNTLQEGRLIAALGGKTNVPQSILSYYDTARTMPQYTGQSSYVPTAKKGGGGWDFAGGVMDALSYLDTSKLGAGKTPPINPSTEAWKTANTSANIVPTMSDPSANPISGLIQRLKFPQQGQG